VIGENMTQSGENYNIERFEAELTMYQRILKEADGETYIKIAKEYSRFARRVADSLEGKTDIDSIQLRILALSRCIHANQLLVTAIAVEYANRLR
jgi:hypothetical protein